MVFFVCLFLYLSHFLKIRHRCFTMLCWFLLHNKVNQSLLLLFKHYVTSYSFGTPWTVTCHTPLFMGFPRQECWGWWPWISPRDLPDPGIRLMSPALAGRFFTNWATRHQTLCRHISPPSWSSFPPHPSHPSESPRSKWVLHNDIVKKFLVSTWNFYTQFFI